MSAITIIGACVCFLAVVTVTAIPMYFIWKDGDAPNFFTEKGKKKKGMPKTLLSNYHFFSFSAASKRS